MAISKQTLLNSLSSFLDEADERYFGVDSAATSVIVSDTIPRNQRSHWVCLSGETTTGELTTSLITVSANSPTATDSIWIATND